MPISPTRKPPTAFSGRNVPLACVAALAASLAFCGQAAGDLAASPPAFVAQWGASGTGDGQFTRPNAIAADAQGNVYVGDCAAVDTGSGDRIQKFSPAGAFLSKWGSTGTGDGQFSCPTGLAVDPGGNVLVTDCGRAPTRGTLQRFDGDGAFQARLDTGLTCPDGVAVNSLGTILVLQKNLDQVVLIDPNGNQVGTWGTEGNGDGQLDGPVSVAVGPDGSVYVADWWNDRIEKLSASGAFQAKWGSTGAGDGQFNGPSAVATDSAGYVYVTDAANNRVQKFSGTGSFVTKWGIEGSAAGQFQYPKAIVVDVLGNVLVTDLNNDRVQKFTYAPNVKLSGKRTQRATGALKIGVACAVAGCVASATASVNAPGAAKRYKLKSGSIEIAANGSAALKLKLKRSVARALSKAAAKRRLKAQVKVSAQGAIGTPVTAKRTVRLTG